MTEQTAFHLRRKVREQLIERIKQQSLEGNLQLPAEVDLAQELEVSRATVREVLSELAGEGWLIRRHGSGTFINPTISKRRTPLTPMPYFWDIIASYGKKPSIRFINYSSVNSPGTASIQLQLSDKSKLVCLTLAYCADEEVCIVCNDYFDSNLINPETFAPMKQCSIFQMLYEVTGNIVVWANTVLTATDTLRAPQVGKLMQIKAAESKPLLLAKNLFYDTKDKPILYTESFFATDFIEFEYVQQYGTGRKMDPRTDIN